MNKSELERLVKASVSIADQCTAESPGKGEVLTAAIAQILLAAAIGTGYPNGELKKVLLEE